MKHKNKKRHNIRYKKNDRKRDSKKGKMDIKKKRTKAKSTINIYNTCISVCDEYTRAKK
jgi:hypothetical protein